MKNKTNKKSEIVIFKKSRYILTSFFLKNDDNDLKIKRSQHSGSYVATLQPDLK